MTTLLEFISGLLDGVGLVALAVAVGGIAYALIVLRAAGTLPPLLEPAARQTVKASALAAAALAIIRLLQLILKFLALADAMDRWAFGAFAKTQVFQSGLASILLIMTLAGALAWLNRGMSKPGRWALVLTATVLFMVNEAWLSHAASRVEGGGPLMAVTVVHMLGAVVWAGGVTHLFLSWRLVNRHPESLSLWPELVSRFSPLGMISVAVIVVPGLYLAWSYVGDWAGLFGTGYGNMLTVKVVLLTFVILLAAVNFFAARRWVRTGDRRRLDGRVPAYIEVELILATALLFSAASLAGFPPVIDVTQDAATPKEVWAMFSPKAPRLIGPEIVLVEAPEYTDLKTGKVGWKEYERWDQFNHNVSGVFLLLIAFLALLDRIGRVPVVRHWPLMFIALAIAILLFANPSEWPLGPLGFLQSAKNAEVVQHWLAALVILGLGVFEWRARQETLAAAHRRFVLPLLCIAGGLILLTHSHQIFELKREFLIQSTHVAMGLVGVVVGCSRWLELRLPPPQDRIAGFVAVGGMALIGVILLFYVTPD